MLLGPQIKARGKDRVTSVYSRKIRIMLEQVHVVLAGDSAVAPGLAVVLSSLLNATLFPERLHIHVLTTEQDVSKMRDVLSCVTIQRHPANQIEVLTFNATDYDTRRIVRGSSKLSVLPSRLTAELNFARFFLPQIFEFIKDKVIYLDADVVIDGDIVELYDSALRASDMAVAAVPRGAQRLRLAPSVSRNRAAIDELRRRGLELQQSTRLFRQNKNISIDNIKTVSSKHFLRRTTSSKKNFHKRLITPLQDFNAGVLVIHLERWRQMELTSHILEWMRLNTKYELYTRGSNPPLVLALADRFERLDGRWNCPARPSSTPLSPRCQHFPGVLHLTGPHKPWQLQSNDIDPRWRAKLTHHLAKCLKSHLAFDLGSNTDDLRLNRRTFSTSDNSEVFLDTSTSKNDQELVLLALPSAQIANSSSEFLLPPISSPTFIGFLMVSFSILFLISFHKKRKYFSRSTSSSPEGQ